MQMAMEPESEPAVGVPPAAQPTSWVRPPAPDGEPKLPLTPPRAPPPLGALAALGHGARRVLSQPRLLLLVWGLAMLTAMAASLPAMVTLGMVLGKRPAATLLARGQSDVLFGELLTDHPVSVAIVLGSVLLAAGVFFLIQVALSGGLLDALRRPGDPQRVGPPLGQIVARGFLTAGAMARVELLFLLLVRAPLVVLCALALRLAGSSKFIDTHSLPEILWRLGPLAGLSLWLWCSATIVLYATRLSRLEQTAGDNSALSALRAGLHGTLLRPAELRATLALALVAAVGMGALVVVGRVLAARLDYALLVIAALVVRQGFALLRTVLNLSVMAGAVDLWTPPAA